ncbi:Rv2578c family radical SAM protein [Microbacterium sp. MPKO10]|uniref:Rv2578c family radical SAM protein n=1 Tax=Microbacterium sp. MPKO10 TaxID=2989818 RepID=UPI0022366C66|nr:Rv2578c family radical SAM protein [Microbacterium sp. MPKO10]MCW4458891.1 Rv2578c family radical SAM protein [Microbacterium sp. MPKO10]
MRWDSQKLSTDDANALPGLGRPAGLVRSVRTPGFADMTFHEVLAKSALNQVPASSEMPFHWTINPYRGCSHACTYCFARPTHTYLELNAGEDFDKQVVVKTNVAEVLERELTRPSWNRELVALGTNTDPYQRAEGRYRLMPGIIDALARSHTPFSVLTKGTLLRRDIPALADAAREVSVDVAMSIAVYDDELQSTVEPGTPTATARLATVAAAREAGLECGVFLMPILPYLTDSTEQLDDALRRISEAGASYALFSTLYLKPGVKPWFMLWLQRQHPELLPAYERLYSRGAYAPKEYQADLAARVRPLLRAHGLERRRAVRFEEQSRAAAPTANAHSRGVAAGASSSPDAAPMLF